MTNKLLHQTRPKLCTQFISITKQYKFGTLSKFIVPQNFHYLPVISCNQPSFCKFMSNQTFHINLKLHTGWQSPPPPGMLNCGQSCVILLSSCVNLQHNDTVHGKYPIVSTWKCVMTCCFCHLLLFTQCVRTNKPCNKNIQHL